MEDVERIRFHGVDRAYTFLVDSSARDKSAHPTPGHYSVSFNSAFHNVVGFEILEVNIPRTDYILDSTENTLSYSLQMPRDVRTWAADVLPGARTAVFEPGDYNLPQLLRHMNGVLADLALAHGEPPLVLSAVSTPPEISNKVRVECAVPFCILGDGVPVNRAPPSSIRGTLGFGDPVSVSEAASDAPKYSCVPGYSLNFPNGAAGVFVSREGPRSDGAETPAFVGPLPGDLSEFQELHGSSEVRQRFVATASGTPVAVNAYLASLGDPGPTGWLVRVRVVRAGTDETVAVGTTVSSGDDLEPVTARLAAAVGASGRVVEGGAYEVVFSADSGGGVGTAPGQCAAVWFAEPNLPGVDGPVACFDLLVGSWGHRVVSPGIVSLVGAKYIKIRCEELEQHINRDRVNEPTTAGVGMVNLVGYGFMNQRYSFVHYPPIRFHPIGKLQKLTFRLERPDGSLYDANGVDNNMLCALTFRVPRDPTESTSFPAAPGYSSDPLVIERDRWSDQADATRRLGKAGACHR